MAQIGSQLSLQEKRKVEPIFSDPVFWRAARRTDFHLLRCLGAAENGKVEGSGLLLHQRAYSSAAKAITAQHKQKVKNLWLSYDLQEKDATMHPEFQLFRLLPRDCYLSCLFWGSCWGRAWFGCLRSAKTKKSGIACDCSTREPAIPQKTPEGTRDDKERRKTVRCSLFGNYIHSIKIVTYPTKVLEALRIYSWADWWRPFSAQSQSIQTRGDGCLYRCINLSKKS